ncbi:unnamed protein product [Psylliodes chrysocephalus]|uniref:Uncharacterized protein n=1 Tax=Psylliodes chrysocephalus TaxID=3402493 RepID=A0A9P0GKN3_9CUCU|nr:unnamed protein product [Psylliodes chrysocephala]
MYKDINKDQQYTVSYKTLDKEKIEGEIAKLQLEDQLYRKLQYFMREKKLQNYIDEEIAIVKQYAWILRKLYKCQTSQQMMFIIKGQLSIYSYMFMFYQLARAFFIPIPKQMGERKVTLSRYLHHLVHTQERFDFVQISFPIRGHSFMERILD